MSENKITVKTDKREQTAKIIVEIRLCLRCGKEFEINAFQKRKRYCDACKKLHSIEYSKTPERKAKIMAKNRQRKKDNYIPKRHINQCKYCGNSFIVGSGRQPTICIDCLKKSKSAAERERAYYRRNYDTAEQIRIPN